MRSFLSMSTAALTAGLLFAILPPACRASAPRSHKSSAKDSESSIPFRDVHHEIVVTFALNGHKGLNFLIDTGFGMTLLDTSAAAAAHVKTVPVHLYLHSPAGTFSVTQLAHRVRIDGYGLEFHNDILVGDLEPFYKPFGIPLAGIIGSDFLGQFPFLLDYAAKTMTVFSPEKSNVPLKNGIEVPLELFLPGKGDGPAVWLDAELPDGQKVKAALTVDTGSTAGVILNAPFVERYSLKPDDKVRPPIARGYGGKIDLVPGQLPALMIGSLRVSDFDTLFARQPAGSPGSGDTDGEIGYGILSRFRIYMDAPHQRVVFDPVSER